MTANTGRTVSRFMNFIVDDSGSTKRSIPVDSINDVGLEYPEKDVTAFQDALKGALPETPDCVIKISGPFDNSAVNASTAILSGSHTVLKDIVGGVTPLTIDIQVGIRHTWVADEPQFGITASTANGFLCSKYNVNLDDMKYEAEFVVYPGSIAPAWGIAAET